ncbi:hypothetical protein Ocin01_19864 [Orchesella cincta]|uniref:Uncharacterized protein n=1 Tax=Orchesella cincta TaxID=48709 RepID=A0A1D2M1H9_ORCCI|nr:hypothetical protein Ocin01_19864 [Orchesella cincta]
MIRSAATASKSSDLTGLRYFGMGCETGGKPNTDLSNESVLNAIFPLKNLQGITAVYDEDVDKMSVEIRDQLLSKFPKSKIMKSGDRVREWSWSSSDEPDDTEEEESSEGDSDDWSDVEENSNDE